MAIHESRVLKGNLQYTDDGDRVVKSSRRFNGADLNATEEGMNAFFNAVDQLTTDTLTDRFYVDTFALAEAE